MHTMRKTSGLAGFPKRDESVHDAFGAGHSSTSISAGLGMCSCYTILFDSKEEQWYYFIVMHKFVFSSKV